MNNYKFYEKYGRSIWVILTSFILMITFIFRIFAIPAIFTGFEFEYGGISAVISLALLGITIASFVLFVISLVKVLSDDKTSKKFFKNMLWVNLGLAIAYFLLSIFNFSFSTSTVNGVFSENASFSITISVSAYLPLVVVVIALVIERVIGKKIKLQKCLEDLSAENNDSDVA